MKTNVKIFKNNDHISRFLVGEFEKIFEEKLKAKGKFIVALSGGNTPIPFYNELSKTGILFPWENCHFFIVDERCVKPGHPDHNFSNINKVLFQHIDIPQKNIHIIKTESLNPLKSADLYEKELIKFFKHDIPVFDFMILGLGRDGHTASLFPGSKAVDEEQKYVSVANAPVSPSDRITITFPIINNAENVYVLLTGQDKSEIIKKVFEEESKSYPIAKIIDNPSVIFLVDEAAYSEIQKGKGAH